MVAAAVVTTAEAAAEVAATMEVPAAKAEAQADGGAAIIVRRAVIAAGIIVRPHAVEGIVEAAIGIAHHAARRVTAIITVRLGRSRRSGGECGRTCDDGGADGVFG